MSGYAAIGLALGRPARCPELQPNQRPGGRQANRIASRDEPYDAVVASLLPAPLRKRCHGVIPALRAVLTSGLAPLARRERPTRLPIGRAAWPNRLHAEGSQTACQQDGHARVRLDTLGAPATSVEPRVAPRVEREGEPSSWQARAGAGPWAGSRPPRAKRAPTSARASEGGEVWRRRAASERRRERAKRATAFIRRDVVAPGLGVGLSLSWSWVWLHVPGSEPRADRPSPVSSWHRTRRATSRRRRVALVDGSERLGRALIHGAHVSAR